MASPFSDDVVPHLSERDARTLTQHVIERLQTLGVRPSRFGILLDQEGFWFTADIHGKTVSARTGQGAFTYDAVARELVLASVDPGWDRLTIQKG